MAEFRPENELLPHTIDHYARTKPDQLYAEYPRSPMSYDQGYRPITYRDFANAINGIASWLVETLGAGDGEVLAYIGPNDVRYPALVMGAVKAGYCMFLPSPRNSIAAHESLFRDLDCTKLLTSTPRPPPVTAVVEALHLTTYEVPSVEDLLTIPYPHFEYSKTYPKDASNKMVAVHTSGSTGIPKPIIWTLEIANRHMRMVALNTPDGYDDQHSWLRNKRKFLTLPPFHAAGLASVLFISVPANTTIIAPTSGGLPTAAALVEARKQTPFETALLVPSVVHELAQNPELLAYCSEHLEFLEYCGGDLPQAIGDAVAAKIKLANQYGATELGMLSVIHSFEHRDPLQDWRWMQFHPDLRYEFRQVTDDEYELFLIRSPESEVHQLPFNIFPQLQEYPTRDLFVRHPDENKANLWRWSSRADDVIVFLNGEKTNPVSMEQHVTASNPEVSGALVAGAQRFQASLLVEFGSKALDPSERAAAIEKIWSSIEEANRVCPAHARIARTHILFTTPEKPMLRAGKGTVQRAGTIALYAPELKALYADADRLAVQTERNGPGRVDDSQQVSSFIQQTLSSITGWSDEQIRSTENFYHLGLDSLQTITAARSLKRGFDLSSFTPNLIYLHPSLPGLTQATVQLMRDDQTSKEAVREALMKERWELLKELLGQIDSQIIGHIEPQKNDQDDGPQSHTVVLTGSTGTLGTYILDALLKNSSVAHVHCLNRRQDSAAIQHQKRDFYNLDTPLDFSRVSFWQADLSRDDLGLSPRTLRLLQDTATVIIHNAWTVNFNLSLSSFKPNLSSVVNLITFTSTTAAQANLFFVSSISSVMGHHTESNLTPEIIVSTSTPAPNGYANSKYLAEQLLDHAAWSHSLRTSFARVAQVAGAVNTPGLWKKSEWFPSLVASSLRVRAVPDGLGPTLDRVDWVPVDLLAGVLVDLALREPSKTSSDSVEVFHPMNLYPTTWKEILPVVVDALADFSDDKALQTVPLVEWVQLVRQDIETAVAAGKAVGDGELQGLLEKNPAAKLLEFFEGIASAGDENALDTRRTALRSEKLRAIGGVEGAWIRKWIGELMQSST